MGPDDPAIPCGLVAKSFFNDRFGPLKKEGGTDITALDDKNIAWESEKARYKNIKTKNTTEVDWKTIQWQDMEDGKLLLFIYFYGFLFNLLF